MDITIKAAAAFYTPDGIVADTPKKSKLAEYSEQIDENTYTEFGNKEFMV